jgi:crotonobetaine/carnitine-CoA ligase
MIPRYVEFMDALPKTTTEKVLKAALKELGLNPNTWDSEKAGYKVRR